LCAVLLANTESDTYSYSNAQWDSHINTDSNAQCDPNANRNAKSHTNSETQSNAAVSPHPTTATLAFADEKETHCSTRTSGREPPKNFGVGFR
jgi:hypothetical protein